MNSVPFLSVFSEISHGSLVDAVLDQIEELILDGVLPEQSRLPSERELAAQLKVSRPKVREALKILEDRGLVRIQANSGVFIEKLVNSAIGRPLVDLYQRHPWAIQDHLDYRKEQEGFAARLAAERATAFDRQQLRALTEKMAEAHRKGDHELGATLDHDFHMTIVSASYNRTLMLMMKSLHEFNRRGVIYSRQALLNIEQVSERLQLEHAGIAEAIVQGNPAEAERLSRAHIAFIGESVQAAFTQHQREVIARKRYGR